MEYTLNGLSSDDLQGQVDKFLEDVAAGDPAALEAVKKESLDPEEVKAALAQAAPDKPIEVRPTGAALDPVTTQIAIEVVKLGGKILTDLWTHVVLPWIKKRNQGAAIDPVPTKTVGAPGEK